MRRLLGEGCGERVSEGHGREGKREKRRSGVPSAWLSVGLLDRGEDEEDGGPARHFWFVRYRSVAVLSRLTSYLEVRCG